MATRIELHGDPRTNPPLPAPRARHCTAGAAGPRRWHGGEEGHQAPAAAGARVVVVTGAHLPRPRGGGARSRRPPGRRRSPPRPRLPRRLLQLPPPPSGPPRHQIRGRRGARGGGGGGVEWGRSDARREGGGGGGEEPSQAAGVRPSPARTASRFCSAPTCTSPVSHPRARKAATETNRGRKIPGAPRLRTQPRSMGVGMAAGSCRRNFIYATPPSELN